MLGVTERRKRDVKKLGQVMEDMKQVKSFMVEKIKHNSLFEVFLNDVIAQTENVDISEMINRYSSLLQARNDLADLQESNFRSLENARSDMVRH